MVNKAQPVVRPRWLSTSGPLAASALIKRALIKRALIKRALVTDSDVEMRCGSQSKHNNNQNGLCRDR